MICLGLELPRVLLHQISELQLRQASYDQGMEGMQEDVSLQE